MSYFAKYKFFLSMLLLFIILCGSLFTTHVPSAGYLQANNAPVTFRLAYFGEQQSQLKLRDWIEALKPVSLFTSTDFMFEQNKELPLTSFFPVYDATSTMEQFNQDYPYLPAHPVTAYGRSVYTIDYGNARLLYLNATSLKNTWSHQLEWMNEMLSTNKQVHNIVFLSEDPKLADFWETMRWVGVSLVFIQDKVYTPTAVISQESAEYRTAGYDGWGLWDVFHQFAEPHALIVEGRDNKLTVRAQGRQGEGLDQLLLDVTRLRYADHVEEGAYVSIQSLWRYQPGSQAIKTTIPEDYDITGENPIQQAFDLPAEDWRSPEFNDAAWEVGRAPLGHTGNKADLRQIKSLLPVVPGSPVYYFRKTFEIHDDVNLIHDLYLHVAFEDGFVAYINGSEVARDTIREGYVDHRSLALPSEFNAYVRFPIESHIDKLKQGANTIAVEIHRSHPKAPNMLFDLSLSYEQ